MTQTEATLYLLPSNVSGIWVNFLHLKVHAVNFIIVGTLRAKRCNVKKTGGFPDSLQRPVPAPSECCLISSPTLALSLHHGEIADVEHTTTLKFLIGKYFA
jgi:hypothetical protein